MRRIKTFSSYQINEELGKKDILAVLMSLSFLKPVQAAKIADEIQKKPESVKTNILDRLSDAETTADVMNAVYSKEDSVKSVIREHITAFKGYKPLGFEQRAAWNEYLRYLGELGLAGSPELDEKTRGINELKKYLKERPSNPLNEYSDKVVLVKSIQYEMVLMRKGDSGFPGLNDSDLSIFQEWLFLTRPAYMKLIPSAIDGKPGQLTTRLWYPAKTLSGRITNESFDYAKQIEDIALTMVTKYGIRYVDDQDLVKKISAKNMRFLSGF